MTSLLAVDPGIRGCGAALFYDGHLERACYIKNTEKTGNSPREVATMVRVIVSLFGEWVDRLALEFPRVYYGKNRNKDPNDLFALAGVDCGLAVKYTMANITTYYPSDWKGQIPKPKHGDEYIIKLRIEKRLDDLEKTKILLPSAASLHHNVWDAIGIGLKAVDRF